MLALTHVCMRHVCKRALLRARSATVHYSALARKVDAALDSLCLLRHEGVLFERDGLVRLRAGELRERVHDVVFPGGSARPLQTAPLLRAVPTGDAWPRSKLPADAGGQLWQVWQQGQQAAAAPWSASPRA